MKTHSLASTLLAALLLLTASARAATYTWTGAGFMGSQDFLFSNPYNWAGLDAPSAGEASVTLVFSNGYPKTVTNDIAGLAVASIRFQGSNYVIHGKPSGNTLTLRSTSLGGYSILATGNNCQFAGNCPLVLSNGGFVNVGALNTLKMSSVLSGPGGIIKAGPGTLLFNATLANTYAGPTTVSDGILDLQNGLFVFSSFVPYVSVPGPVVIGNGDPDYSPVVRLLADNQIADDAAVTVNENSKLWLNTQDDTLGPLTLRGGLVNTGQGGSSTSPGTLTLNGNVTNQLSSLDGYHGSISGRLGLGLFTRTFSVAAGSQLGIDANISGGSVTPFIAGFTLVGGGTLLLYQATNTYNGLTTVDHGTLFLSGSTPLLGSTNSGTIVNSNGLLFLSGVTNSYEPLTLNGGATPVVGWEQWNEWRGPVSLNGDCRFDITTTNHVDQVSLLATVSGPGILHKTGSGGAIRLGGTTGNTFTGGAVVDGGMIIAEKTSGLPVLNGPLVIGLMDETNSHASFSILSSSQIPDATPVSILESGTLRIFNDLTEVLGHVELRAGTLQAADAGETMGIPFGPGIFTLSGNVTNRSAPSGGGGYTEAALYGPIHLGPGNHVIHGEVSSSLSVKGTLQGSGSLTKTGPGRLEFRNTNNYAGLTLIAEGLLSLYFEGLPGSIDGGTTVGTAGTLELYSAAVTNETLTIQPGGHVKWGSAQGNRWKGPVTLEADAFFSSTSTSLLFLDGLISGPGGITLPANNSGGLVLAGVADNTYASPTIVLGGALHLQKDAFAIPGDLIVGSATNLAPMPVVGFYRSNQFALASGSQLQTRTVTLYPMATFNLNGHDQRIANLLMVGASLETGTATLTLDRNLTGQSLGSGCWLAGKLALTTVEGVSNHLFSVPALYDVLNVTASIQESSVPSSVEKTGPGWLGLGGYNTFSGSLVIGQGIADGYSYLPFGTAAGSTFVQPGATLKIGYMTTNAEPLVLAAGSQVQTSDTNIQTGSVTLLGDATLHVETNSVFTIQVPVAGAGGFTKAGPGRLRLAGNAPNLYGGTTRLAAGFLDLAKTSSNAIPHDLIVGEPAGFMQWLGSNQIADVAALIITNLGGAYLNGHSDTIGSLAGNQFLFLDTGALTVGANHSSTLYSGFLSGTGGTLTKIGNGTLTLTANNAQTGVTTVNGGKLIVQGSQPSSAVYVANGTLGGTGAVGSITVANAGRLSPGNSPGKLSGGTLNFLGNSATLAVEINGPTPGTDYDQVQIAGGVSFMGGTLNLAMNFSGAVSNQYVLIANDGSDIVGGTFTGLPESAMLTNNGAVFQITYHGGDGNDVALIQQSVFSPHIGAATISGGALQLSGLGLPGDIYGVEATQSLAPPVEWVTIGDVHADANGVIQFQDGDMAHYPMRFYRLIKQ